MFIRRIKLDNFCQHVSLDKKLTGNLVAVIGNNGTGKSNLLGAVQFGLTGSIPKVDKTSLLREGASSGSVEIEFEHQGEAWCIHRRIDKAEAGLYRNGEQLTSKVQETNAALDTLLGLDSDIARQSVFVRQGELAEILFADPAVRQRSWQAMAGLGQADKIHTLLGQCISALPGCTDYEPVIREIIESLGTEWRQYRDAQKMFADLRRQSAAAPKVDMHRIQQLESLRQSSERMAALEGRIRQQNDDNSVNACKLEELVKSGPQNTAGLDTLRNEREKLGAEAVKLEQQISIRQSAERLRAQLACAEQTFNTLSEQVPAESVDKLSDMLHEALQQVARVRGMEQLFRNLAASLQNAEGLKQCPVCDSDLSSASGLADRLLEKAGAEAATASGMDQVAGKLKHDVDSERARQTRLASLAQELAGLKRQLDEQEREISTDDPAARLTELWGKQQQLTEQISGIEQLEAAGTQLRNALSVGEQQLRNLQAEYTDTQTMVQTLLNDLGVARADSIAGLLAAAQEDAGKRSDLDNRVAGAAGTASARREAVRKLINTLRESRKRDTAQSELRKVIKVAEETRKWFHYSQGPRMVIIDVIDRLTPKINMLLNQFGSPFAVIPDYENTLFRYIKGTGSNPMPVDRLSGGERAMLATSFRMAGYSMFAAKLGLLTLDEPTVYLDSANVQMFAQNLVHKLHEMCTSMNLQLFMSTHEESIIPLCDDVINLNMPTKETDDGE